MNTSPCRISGLVTHGTGRGAARREVIYSFKPNDWPIYGRLRLLPVSLTPKGGTSIAFAWKRACKH